MPADLLFEIGCEEVPATQLAKQLADLPKLVEDRLAAARLTHGGVRVLGTPRRLAVMVKQLVDRQPDINEEVVGPPVSAAFAADGAVTKAGQGFAAKNGVDPASLQKKEVPGKKGQYAVAVRHIVGQDTRALLPSLLVELAGALVWPKAQRWGWGETTFVRPVQWLVALFGGEVIPLTWAGLTSGRASRGHRFLSPGPVEIGSPDRYVDALRAAHVVVDPEARRKLVRGELSRLEQETGCTVRHDEELLDEVIYLGEYPVGVSGHFDPAYLEVPEEMIVTAMRTHQRYFAMQDASGKLANRFATMMATVVKDPKVVAQGNEKVLAARLSDAKFFYTEDKKQSLADWNVKLGTVVFQAKFGHGFQTVGNKVDRIVELASNLGGQVQADVTSIKAAARICKADLASKAVYEFPELQGVMGRYYALNAKMTPAVARAVEEHWWPKGQGAPLPTTDEAAVIAVADRMDTLVGCFAAGLVPSGSADPFGLRRAAIGILSILLARRWPIGLDAILEASLASYRRQDLPPSPPTVPAIVRTPLNLAGVTPALLEFLRTRLRGLFVEEGVGVQEVEAALGAGFDDPNDAMARAKALSRVPKEAREVFKRVANILDDAKAKNIVPAAAIDQSLFAKDKTVEQNLHAAVAAAQAREAAPRKARDYAAVLDSLVQLQPTVAAFFDKGGVMVMDPDPKLRDNRLALLHWLITPYMQIADFRLLGAS